MLELIVGAVAGAAITVSSKVVYTWVDAKLTAAEAAVKKDVANTVLSKL